MNYLLKLTINSTVKVPVPAPMLFLNVAITVSFLLGDKLDSCVNINTEFHRCANVHAFIFIIERLPLRPACRLFCDLFNIPYHSIPD